MRLLSLRVMTVLSSAVYKKSLLLSAVGRQQYTAGEVVNLIAVDCSKVYHFYIMMYSIWAAFLVMLLLFKHSHNTAQMILTPYSL